MDKEYIFTFGFNQGHDSGFVSIKADSPEKARDEMVRRFGVKWGFQYDAPDAREKAGVEMFGLKEVK